MNEQRAIPRGHLLILLLAVSIASCRRGQTSNATAPTSAESPAARAWFRDVTAERGIAAKPFNWPDGTLATPEVTGGGVALFDYDNDGRLDILQICRPPPGHLHEVASCRLFHQEPNGSFREVPGAGGMYQIEYGQGVAIGDYDGDGFPDVFITGFGKNHLFHNNNGDGTFTDVTEKAGLATAKDYWSSSATWFDYDRDGRIDLYVCHFADFDPKRVCLGDDGKPGYCGPSEFKGTRHALYHNNGDGTFTDVAEKAGISYPGRGWGVVAADFTGDGWPDIYVANDAEQQNLYVNQHDGTFKDEAIERGVAFSGMGRPEAGMGVAAGDVFNNGRLCLFITHFRDEKNTLYVPTTQGLFRDGSGDAGMASVDLPYTGWGCGFFDLDNDGNLDIAVTNGAVARGKHWPNGHLTPFWNNYAEPNLLFTGNGHGHFEDVTANAGDFAARAENTRGLAFGDLANHGCIDLITNTIDNTLHVYQNVGNSAGNHWVTIRAMTGKRDALGARVEVTATGQPRVRIASAGYSYCSSSDPRAHFGLGPAKRIEKVTVLWPDGSREQFPGPPVDRIATIRQGTGEKVN